VKRAGQIALVAFPHTDMAYGKLRPVLLLRQTSHRFDDWLVCMISSQVRQADPELDELIVPDDDDFADSGLKTASVVRLSRLAVVNGAILAGCLGHIAPERLVRLRQKLAAWLTEDPASTTP
jgi:mRNA interferase MazF